MGFLDSLMGLFRKKDAATWAADARERLARQRPARALSAAERAIELAPGDADLLLLRAEILRALDLQERALADVLAALEREPGRAAALLPMLEALEKRAPEPHLVWLHTWVVYAGRGDLPRASECVAALARRGDAAVAALRKQCATLRSGSGDRRVACVGLASLARATGDLDQAVDRLLELAAMGSREDLAWADTFLQDLIERRADFPAATRALVHVRILRGEADEARDLVLWLCRKEPSAGVDILEHLLAGEPAAANFALALAADLEKSGKVPPRLSVLLAEGLLRGRRVREAAGVVLRALDRDPASAEELLPLATRVRKGDPGLEALEAHARAAVLAGDPDSALMTLEEFVETDAARALAVLETLTAAERARGTAALLLSRARAGLGDDERAAADLRRWAMGGDAAQALAGIPHVRAVAQARPNFPGYALLLHDLLRVAGETGAAGEVLRDLVARHPGEAERVSRRAGTLIEEMPTCFPALLAAARAGLVRGDDPGAVLRHYRAAIEAAPEREPEVLADLAAAAAFVNGVEPMELFRAELVLRTGRVPEGLAALEEIVLRNPARGTEALAVLRSFERGAGAGSQEVLLAEHRIRRLLRDHEGSVLALRRVADRGADIRAQVLALVDEIIAEAPGCRGAHRAGVEITVRLGHAPAETLRRLGALLDIPTPPRDTEFVTRRTRALQGETPTVAGCRLLVLCHLHAERWPLAVEETRRLVEADPSTRGEATGYLTRILHRSPSLLEARLLLASLHALLGAVDAAREVLTAAVPRTDLVFQGFRNLVAAYPHHVPVRLDLVDALVRERRLDDALEEIPRILELTGVHLPDLVDRVQRILELSPEYAPALYTLAAVHHQAGNRLEEIEACGRVLRLAPREAESVVGRMDRILEKDPACVEAALEIVRLVRLHGHRDRVGPEARRALDASRTPAQVAAVAEVLVELEPLMDADDAYREVLALALARAGRAQEAVNAFAILLRRNPGSAAVVARGVERFTAESDDTAVEALRVLHEARLLEGRPAEACAAIAALLQKRPALVDEARRRYGSTLAEHPDSREAAEGVAATAVLAGLPDAAVEAHLHLLRRHPDLRRDVGRALQALRQRFPEAASACLALAEYIHLPLDLLDDSAAELETALDINVGCHGRVLPLASIILQRDPRSPRGLRARGRAQVAAGDLAAATETFRFMAGVDPRHREDSLRGLDSVLAVNFRHPEAQFRRAEILRNLRRDEEAVDQAERLIEHLHPGDPAEYRALILLSEAREGIGDFAGALAALRMAAVRHPGEPGVLPRVRSNRAAALAAKARALRDAPADRRSTADLELAETLLAAGDPRASLASVGPLPEKGEALVRWKVLRAQAFLALESGGSALAEIEDALKTRGIENGESPVARDALLVAGLAHLRTGESVKAIRRLEQLARVDPKHGRVREILDLLYDEDRRKLDRPLVLTADLEALPVAVAKGGARG